MRRKQQVGPDKNLNPGCEMHDPGGHLKFLIRQMRKMYQNF